MDEGSLECSRPKAWPSSWTATRKTSLPSERNEQRYPCLSFGLCGLTLTPTSPLTTLVGPDGPGFGQIKVRVAPNAVPREVGVRQEPTLAVERRAVAVEALGEGQHDVRVLVHLVSYVAVRNLPEGDRDDAFPDPEGSPDGLVRGPLAHLRGVVLYAGGQLLGEK